MKWIERGAYQRQLQQDTWPVFAVRFGLPMFAVAVLVVSTLTLLAIHRERQALETGWQQQAESLLDVVETTIITPDLSLDTDIFSDLMEQFALRQEILMAGYLHDREGHVLAEFVEDDAASNREYYDLDQRFTESETTTFKWLSDRLVAGRVVSIRDRVLGAITVQFSTQSFRDKTAGMYTMWLGMALVAMLVSLGSSLLMSHVMARASHPAEEVLRRLEQALATTEVGITITDNEGRIVYTNPADAQMHAYTVDELIGQPATIFAPSEYQITPPSEEEAKGFLHWKRERINIRKDGTKFPVRLISNPITDSQGRSLGKVVVCEDITEYKRAEAALKEEHNLLHALIENSPDMIYVKDTKSRYLLANTAMVRAMAVATQKELLGKTDFDFRPLDTAEQAYADEQAIIHSGQPLINREEPVMHQQSGHIHWLLSTKVPFYDSQGAVNGIVGISRDITSRKRMEAQLLTAHTELKEKSDQLAKLNASKDKFFSIISHDLRNPLNVILGYSETLEYEFKDEYDDRIIPHIQGLREAADKLYTLLENLLTWARIQQGEMIYAPNVWNLNDVVTESIELLLIQARQKQITLCHTVAPEIEVYADFHMLCAILRNLLSNALKFTTHGGRVEVAARFSASYVEVAVSDTGMGIQQEDIPKLFRIDVRYTHIGTAGEEGTGLGLSLCKELVEKNAGTIWVESEVGKGTTFYFTLPCPS